MGAYLSTLFLGAVFGAIYALLAYGLVLAYRTSGVLNFAQGALGMFFAFVYYQLVQGGRLNLVVMVYDQSWRLPRGLALAVVVLVLAPAMGLGLELVLFSKLRRAGSLVQIVATIGLFVSLQGVAGVVWGSGTTLSPRSLFPHRSFTIGSFRASSEELATVLIVLVLCVALLAFLRFSVLGVRMRAVVDRSELAELMAVDSRRVSGVAWAIASGFAALAGILIAPFFGSLQIGTLSFLVVAASAAAVVGKLESLPLTLAGAMGIGMTQLLVQKHVQGELGRLVRPSIPFLVLFLVLLLPINWPAPAVAAAPIPPKQRGDPPSLQSRLIRVGIVAAVLLIPPFLLTGVMEKVLGGAWQTQLATVPPMALIFLSLVVLSGMAGQISLAQGAIAGFGAFLAAHLVADRSYPFLLAAVVAAILTVPLGVLLASRATRLPPLFLGLATLAFGAVMDEWAFTNTNFSGGLSGVRFTRTEFLTSQRAYYLAGLAVFALCALLVHNLRNGRIGLALVAMRDTQTGIASVGADVRRLKLVTFCVSAFLAGLGGALFAGVRQTAAPQDWFTYLSLLFLTLAVIGGIASWSGALLGAAMFTLLAPVLSQPVFIENVVFKNLFGGQLPALLPVFFGLGAIGLARNPHGAIEQTREGFADLRRRLEAKLPPEPRIVSHASAAASTNGTVTFPRSTTFHRPGCVLATGKDAVPVTAAKLRSLSACVLCGPEPVASAPAPRRRQPLRAN